MIVYDGDGGRTLIEAYNCATKAVDFILKGVNIDDMIPDSVKAQEDAELSDITLYADERVRVVNVRRDSRIRFFFTTPPDADRREQLTRAARTDAFPCGSPPPLCTRFGVFGYIMRHLVYPIGRFRVHYAHPCVPDLAFSGTLCATLCTRFGVFGYIMRPLMYPIGRFRVRLHC